MAAVARVGISKTREVRTVQRFATTAWSSDRVDGIDRVGWSRSNVAPCDCSRCLGDSSNRPADMYLEEKRASVDAVSVVHV